MTGNIPILFGLGLLFENIVKFDLLFSDSIELGQWINTVTAVFKYMANLEILYLSAPNGDRFHLASDAIEILDVACKNLKEIYISYYDPKGLLQIIGGKCPNLTICEFHLCSINDDVLCALSQCQNLHHLSIRGSDSTTNGLVVLTNLPQLIELNLHYTLEDCITTQLLLDFARSCPHLDTISFIDYNTHTSLFESSGLFLFDDISEFFIVVVELQVYLKPQYSIADLMIEVLNRCYIYIDKFRRDKILLK